MAWTWAFEKTDGSSVDAPPGAESFATQEDAESWLGQSWPQLLERGIDQAVLFEDGQKVYGPTSLRVGQED